MNEQEKTTIGNIQMLLLPQTSMYTQMLMI